MMADLDLRAGHIHRGLGVVARWPSIAMIIPSDADHDTIVDEMFAGLGPEPTSREIVRAVNNLLAQHQIRSVAMVVEATGGPMAVAFGNVEILIDGQVAVNGSAGLAKQQLTGSSERVTLRAAGLAKAAEPVQPFDLRRGVAPGGGLSLVRLAAVEPPSLSDIAPGAAESAAPAPVESDQAETGAGVAGNDQAWGSTPPTPMEAPFRSVLLTDAAPPASVVPLPVAGESAGESGSDDSDEKAQPRGRVEVEGILCSRGHFNNPQTAYCMVCGVSMAHLTPNKVMRPRPTLGFIVFDDGSSFGLDRSYLIGREPVSANGGDAEMLVVHDNNDTLSRTHAELRLVDWTVQLIDLGSTNGTYIWDHENERWNQLTAGHAVELHSGETVALGRRTFVFEGVGSPDDTA